MRERFTYEISNSSNGEWETVETRSALFGREPHEVARSVLESWIIQHPETLTGGERIVLPTERHPDPLALIQPTLRVRIFRGPKRSHEPEPSAVGYLGHDNRDFTGEHPVVGPREVWDRVRRYAGDVEWRRIPEKSKQVARKAVTERKVETSIAAAASVVLAGWAASRFRRSRRRKNRV